MISIDREYKGWHISIQPNVENNKSVLCVIRNDKMNKAFMLTKKCSYETFSIIEYHYTWLSSKRIEKPKQTFYLENEAANELIVEAKTIIDIFDEMNSYLTNEITSKLMQIKITKGDN